MPKPAKTLSEAFLRVREYLHTGDTNSTDWRELQICFAALNARRSGAIKPEHYTRITDIIRERLGEHLGVRSYLHCELKVPIKDFSLQKIQDYRHAWLIHLAQEFEDKNETN